MKVLTHKQLERQNELKKIVKQLSSVSQVSTRDIRKDIDKTTVSKNAKRAKYYVEYDSLLKQKRTSSTPHFALTMRLQADRNNKIGSLNDKRIESEAALKMVNFEYKKLQAKKQQIAKKYRQFINRCNPPVVKRKPIYYPIDLAQIAPPQDVFKDADLGKQYECQDVDEQFLNRVKTTVNSSRKQIKKLYDGHLKSIRQLSISTKKKRVGPSLSDLNMKELLEEPMSPVKMPSSMERNPSQNRQVLNQTQPFAIQLAASPITNRRQKHKRRSLIDLIRMSTSRIKNRQQGPDQKMTMRQRIQYTHIDDTLRSLKKQIDKDNKFKESVVFTGLKKLLYGDRKGKFIQDNAFKTRLKGENTQSYISILKQQQKIFQTFEGSYFNRRNLSEKLSEILGLLNRSEKPILTHRSMYN